MPRRFFLMPRDVRILELLGDYGIMPSTMLHERFWRGKGLRACQNRLALLCEHGLLRSMIPSIQTGRLRGGAVPIVYALTPKGADLVEAETALRPQRLVHQPLSAMTLHHRLDLLRTRLLWDDACTAASCPRPQWFLDSDHNPNASTTASPTQRKLLDDSFKERGQRVVYCPDAVCLTKLPGPHGTIPLICVWEIDRSTEGHRQLTEKLPGLALSLRSKVYRKHFPETPVEHFRSMWITRTDRRLQEIRKPFQSHEVAPVLRFAALRTLQPCFSLYDSVWTDADGLKRSICKPETVI